MKKWFIIFISYYLTFSYAIAEESTIQLTSDHPDQHIVQKGDTLWDIAGQFLEKPWLWPDVWHDNPQIDNPHLIYPGDVVYLHYVDGKPRLGLNRGGKQIIHNDQQAEAITSIPLDAINSFLTGSRVVKKETLSNAPYVISSEEQQLIAGAGNNVYARGDFSNSNKHVGIYRQGSVYIDPDTKEILGHEAQAIGIGRQLAQDNDVATLFLEKSHEEVRIGDRLLPLEQNNLQPIFHPSAPNQAVDGKIISVLGGVTQVGQYDVVAINRGSREGIKEGNVLAIYKQGGLILDRKNREKVALPSIQAGMLMVFQVFDKVSYGLVLKATKPLSILDEVRNPL